METNRLKLNKLAKSFKNNQVLKDLSLVFESGKVYGFLGNNGAGKTTTIKLIFNEILPNSGTITYNNTVQKNIDYSQWYFFAENNELPQNITIYDYFQTVRVLAKLPKKEFSERLKKSLAILDWQINNRKKIKDLSAGQKKLLSALIALILKPLVIFFDEPTANLDIQNKDLILEIMKALISEQRIIVITTHLIDEVKSLLTDIVILDQGEIKYNAVYDQKHENIKKIFDQYTTNLKVKEQKEAIKEFIND